VTGLSVDGAALTSLGANQWAYDSLILEENWGATSMSITVSAVPEPSTVALGGAGALVCGGAALRRWRQRKRA